jgi:hypothetical protein
MEPADWSMNVDGARQLVLVVVLMIGLDFRIGNV